MQCNFWAHSVTWRGYCDLRTIWHWKSGPSANTVSSLCCKISSSWCCRSRCWWKSWSLESLQKLFLTLRLNDRGIIQKSSIDNFSLPPFLLSYSCRLCGFNGWQCTQRNGGAIGTLETFGIENPDPVLIQFLSLVAKFRAHDAVDQDVDGRVRHWKVCRNCFLNLFCGVIQKGYTSSKRQSVIPSFW